MSIEFTPIEWVDTDDPTTPATPADPHLDAETLNAREQFLASVVDQVNALTADAGQTELDLAAKADLVGGTVPDAQIPTAITRDTELAAAVAAVPEQAQDATAAMFAGGSHTGISFAYNDAAGTLSATASGGASLTPTYAQPTIREVVSGSAPDTDTDGFTLTTSSAVQAGDTLLVIHGNDWNYDVNMHAPGGDVGAWDLVENAAGGVNVPHLKAWRAVAATGGVKTVTVAQASLGSDSYYGTLIVFAGPVVCELADTARGATGPSQVAPSLAGGAGRLLLAAFASGYTGSASTTYSGVPSGMTQRSLAATGGVSGGTGAMLVATEQINAAGATGTRTATYSDNRQWAAMSLLLTQRTDPVGDALAAAPSLEELQAGLALGTISTAVTFSLTVAMNDMRVPAFAIAAAPLTASDTNYWTVRLDRYRQGVPATLATKTTQTAAPNGGVASGTAWTFDLVAFDPDNCRLRKGDVLAITFTPTGTPEAWTAAVGTWRYEPGIPG